MIRPYQSRDWSAVARLWLQGNLQAHSFIAPAYWQSYLPHLQGALAEAEVWVYESDEAEDSNVVNEVGEVRDADAVNEVGEVRDADVVKGFIGLCGTYVAGLFVGESVRSQGIGRQLLTYAKRHRERLSLAVYARNAAALRFYEREGFQVVTRQIDEATGEVEVVMQWSRKDDQ